jgi:hypothetical protein
MILFKTFHFNKVLKLFKLNRIKYIIKINKLVLYSPLYNLLAI